MYHIWFERTVPTEYLPIFQAVAQGICPGDEVERNPLHQIELADAVIAGGRIYDAALMDQAPRLLIIARSGIGYEKVDVAAATARRIAVVNTPDAPTVSTAECAITLMMAVARNIKKVEKDLRDMLESGERRNVWSTYIALELDGLTLGLVGMGRIGSRVARIAQAIGMKVCAFDPFITHQRAQELGVQKIETLEALLGMADVVSLHLPLTPDTYKIMNAERFAQMKPGAVFINVSRGGHVDEAALLAALDSGHLFGAGLDVTDPEPPEADNPLLYRDNVVLTPHIASATLTGRERLFVHAIEQVLQTLRGERPPHLINPEVWDDVRSRWEASRP